MTTRFPKRLTIDLPELLREGLQQISLREPSADPAALIEPVLAAGISSKIATYKDDRDPGEDGPVAAPVVDPHGAGATTIAATVSICLGRQQRDALTRILDQRRSEDLETFVLWMFEWGLDAYRQKLTLLDLTPHEGEATP